MFVLQKNLETAKTKIEALSMDLQKYSQLTNEALQNNLRSVDNLQQPAIDNLQIQVGIRPEDDAKNLKPSQSQQQNEFSSPITGQGILASQQSLAPKLKFINIAKFDSTVKANLTARSRNTSPGGFQEQAGKASYSSMLAHDYLAQKLFDFIKRYNNELSRFQLDNRGSSMLQSPAGVQTHQRSNSLFDYAYPKTQNTESLSKNSKQIQKLALSQQIGNTVYSNLVDIISSGGSSNDRILQKSMIGNLHMWLVEMNEKYLKDLEEQTSFSVSYNRGSHLRTDLDTMTNAKHSLESLSLGRNEKSLGEFRSPSVNVEKLKPTGFLLGATPTRAVLRLNPQMASDYHTMNNASMRQSPSHSGELTSVADTIQPTEDGQEKQYDALKEVSREHLLQGSILRPSGGKKVNKKDILKPTEASQFKNQHLNKLKRMSIRNVSILGTLDPAAGPSLKRKDCIKPAMFEEMTGITSSLTGSLTSSGTIPDGRTSMVSDPKTGLKVEVKSVADRDSSKSGTKSRINMTLKSPLLRQNTQKESSALPELSSAIKVEGLDESFDRRRGVPIERVQVDTQTNNEGTPLTANKFMRTQGMGIGILEKRRSDLGSIPDVSLKDKQSTKEKGSSNTHASGSHPVEALALPKILDSTKKNSEEDDTQSRGSVASGESSAVSTNSKLSRKSHHRRRSRRKTESKKRVPIRPFQPPPKVIDATADTPYEVRWIPILKPDQRKPLDGEELYHHIYDRRQVDMNLFEAFQDQGQTLRAFGSPEECVQAASFWKTEELLAKKAEEIIKKFEKINPHDFFKIEPQSYNLSIQYEQDRKDNEAKQKQKEKKKKDLMDKAQGSGKKEVQTMSKRADSPPTAGAGGKMQATSNKSLPSQHKQMSQALEQIVEEYGSQGALPLFKRGPEIEITTMQDVEMLKAMLAQNKIHIPTKVLERSIVMPRDLDNYHPGYAKIEHSLLKNPFKNETKEKKKKKGRAVDMDANTRGLMRQGVNQQKEGASNLLRNEKFEYKVYEFGNYPLLDNQRPKGGQFRMVLPAEADWTGKDPPEVEIERRQKVQEQEVRVTEKQRKLRERREQKEKEYEEYYTKIKNEQAGLSV